MPKQAHAKTKRNNAQLPKSRSGKTLTHSDSVPAIESEDKRDLQDARRALKEAGQKGSFPWEQVKRELGI
jgi:hypothetical protein